MFRATAGGDTENDISQKLADRLGGKKNSNLSKKQIKRKRNAGDLSLN